MNIWEPMVEILKRNPKKIIFAEGTDARVLEAASRLLSGNFLHPIMIGSEQDVMNAAFDAGYNIRGATFVDPMNFEAFDEMVEDFVEIRRDKGMTREKAEELLRQPNYFATMLLKMGYGDCMLSGANHSTADTVRPALQIIKCKPGNTIVSSCFILDRRQASGGHETFAMADCAINIEPTEDELVEICGETVKVARVFGMQPKVAFLSYSSKGSGKGEEVEKMRGACQKAQRKYPDVPIDGEMQVDAAVSPRVGQQKCPGSPVAGYANTFIFPDVTSANMSYKFAQRFGNYDAYGPILMGLNAQINDLSRGCTGEEVYSMAIITATLS